jgi:hypothetical protein
MLLKKSLAFGSILLAFYLPLAVSVGNIRIIITPSQILNMLM